VPGFLISDVKVDVPSKHIDIKIKGNFISKIADAFKSMFKSTIIHAVEKELVKNVQKELPKALNKVITD
jgi:N-acetyl-beta-hexosaminidase